MTQASDPAGPSGWTMSDAWVFAAIANDRPPAAHTLVQLIAMADGINHDVLTEGELTRAIGRLLSAGLIEADPKADRYRHSGGYRHPQTLATRLVRLGRHNPAAAAAPR